ncbi:hypothetical protein [Frondihabitans cladoniiphilus]|uniref:Uncharacterized protein n=1 Tax=Frondihabitans cladoniiphilus TaxID=715785 RepID=A0ABP8W5E7_9MICO
MSIPRSPYGPAPRRLFRKPLRRLSILLLVLSAIVGGVVWFFGLDIPGSVLVAVAVASVGLTWLAVQEGEPILWPAADTSRSPGSRRDVQQLGWSMKTRGGVHEKTVARAREAARHRLLFLYGLDLFDPADRPAIEQVLAPAVVKMLLSNRGTNTDLTTFTRILGALENLGTAPTTRDPKQQPQQQPPQAQPQRPQAQAQKPRRQQTTPPTERHP